MIRAFKLLRFGFYAPFYCIRFVSAIAGRCLPVPLFKALRKFAGVVISCVLGDLCNRLPAANQLHRCLLQTVFLDVMVDRHTIGLLEQLLQVRHGNRVLCRQLGNPYYWGEAPEVDEFKVKVIPDNAAKILALRNGEIDAILGSSRLSAEGYTEISQDAAFSHAMDDSTNQTRYLGMNLNKAPFNDPLVREAVSYAVNQQELETSVFDGLETAAETLFTNEKPNCGVEVKTYPTDMEKAKQLMKEAGYEDTNDDGILEKDGTSLAIHFNYSQSLASVDNAVLSIAASLKELGFDVTIDAVDMNTWYGALMAGEYDLTFYNTAGGSFDPATDMSNMAPGAMGDPILCQFSAFFENPEIFAELDSTSDSQRVQEIYGMILNGIADQNLLVPVTGTHDLALWNTDKITGYDFYTDASYVDIASVHVK